MKALKLLSLFILAIGLTSCSKDGSTPVTPPENKPVAPTITSQPVSVSVTAPATATFSVTASGTAPLSYQWQKNGVNIADATSASYSIPMTSVADSGSLYRCAISNSVGSVTSNPALLSVQPAPVAPTITTQPVSQTVVAHQTVTFSVSATGTGPLSYQWKKNGSSVAGANSSSYTREVFYTDSGAIYVCSVSNIVGTVVSNPALLSVQLLIALGEPYLGGTIYWLDNSGQHGLIAAVRDQSDSTRGLNFAEAIQACANYGAQYRLPDSTELKLLKIAKDSRIVNNFVSPIFAPSGHYISSTEFNQDPNWIISIGFNDGIMALTNKNGYSNVRAVRSF